MCTKVSLVQVCNIYVESIYESSVDTEREKRGEMDCTGQGWAGWRYRR